MTISQILNDSEPISYKLYADPKEDYKQEIGYL